MSSFKTVEVFAPVPSSSVEVAPATLVGLFNFTFGVGPQDPIYIRPGHWTQQDYLNSDGADWLLYTRSVLSYRIEVQNGGTAIGGASLIIELGDIEVAGVLQMREWVPFHLASGNAFQSSVSGVELPGLVARFKIQTASDTAGAALAVTGAIIVRGL